MTIKPTTLPASPKCWCGGATTMTFPNEGVWSYRCVDSEFHDPASDGRPAEVNLLYVSGPMSGYPECNYPAFKEAATLLRAAGYAVVDPSECQLPEPGHYTDLLKEDIHSLLHCEGVAVLENWWESSGARCEVQVAGVVRMPVRSVAEWLALRAQPEEVLDEAYVEPSEEPGTSNVGVCGECGVPLAIRVDRGGPGVQMYYVHLGPADPVHQPKP